MNDALSTSMFWVGALFAFTPLAVGGVVLWVLWRKRRASDRKTLPPSAETSG